MKAEVIATTPPSDVKVTSTEPAARAGVVTVMLPSVLVTMVAVDVPKRTALTSVKFEPLMTTLCPPSVLPVDVDSDAISGAATYRYAAALWPVPDRLVAEIVTVPAALAGA